MSQKRKNISAAILLLLLASAAGLIGFGCDSMLPSEFKSKEYQISSLDAKGLALLNDSTSHAVVQSRSLSSLTFVTQQQLNTQTENQIVMANYATMIDSLPALVTDSLVWVKYIPTNAVNYALLKVLPGQPKDLTLYTSLFYYQNGTANNFNEYVTVSIVRNDTSVITLTDDMTGEAITGSMTTVAAGGGQRIVPVIKGRFKVQLDQEGTYLVRFTLSSPTAISNPLRPPRVDNQFKVAIIASM